MWQRVRAGVAALVGLLTLAGPLPLHAGTVLVLSQTAAKLTAIDSRTNTPRGSLDLAAGPANLAVSPDGSRAYIAHSDSGKISIVDLATWTVTAELPAPGSPFGLAAAANGKIFVGNWNGDDVYEFDTGTGQTGRRVTIGKAPAHLALTPDGTQLVAVAREANSVTVIATAMFAPSATIAVDRAPFALSVSPDGARALVANAQAGSVSSIDLAKGSVTATTRVGAMPYGVVITADRTLVTNQESSSVSVMAAEGATATVKVGKYPEGIAIGRDGATAYVANWFSDDVSLIDVARLKETARIKMPGGPRALAVVDGSFGP